MVKETFWENLHVGYNTTFVSHVSPSPQLELVQRNVAYYGLNFVHKKDSALECTLVDMHVFDMFRKYHILFLKYCHFATTRPKLFYESVMLVMVKLTKANLPRPKRRPEQRSHQDQRQLTSLNWNHCSFADEKNMSIRIVAVGV